jgi:hypothetical protein
MKSFDREFLEHIFGLYSALRAEKIKQSRHETQQYKSLVSLFDLKNTLSSK